MDYRVEQDGQTYGPADAATLKEWALEGRIRPDCRVFDATGGSVVGADFPGLFPLAQAEPPRQEAARPPEPRNDAHLVETHLVKSILVTVFCNQLLGIPAVVLSAMAESAKNAGDLERAHRHGKTANTLCNVALAIGIIGWIVGILFFVVGLSAPFIFG